MYSSGRLYTFQTNFNLHMILPTTKQFSTKSQNSLPRREPGCSPGAGTFFTHISHCLRVFNSSRYRSVSAVQLTLRLLHRFQTTPFQQFSQPYTNDLELFMNQPTEKQPKTKVELVDELSVDPYTAEILSFINFFNKPIMCFQPYCNHIRR